MHTPSFQPTDFHLRLLCPFHLNGRIDFDRLQALRLAEQPSAVWKQRDPDSGYRGEYLRNAESFVFGSSPSYFFVDPGWLQRWFRDVTAVVLDGRAEEAWLRRPLEGVPRPKSVPISIAFDTGIELFLVNHALGVLSVSWSAPIRFPDRGREGIQLGGLSLQEIQALQYHFTHTKYRALVFRIPTHSTDPHLCANDRDAINATGPMDQPFRDRIGRPGQNMRLEELVNFLLAPIESSIEFFEQSQFLTHLAVRFGKDVEFGDSVVQAALRPWVASLAQVEEPRHAAPVLGHLGVPFEVLSAKHLAAYSYQGAAHLVADQWEGEQSSRSFDAQRVDSIQRKYYIAFLAALAQRLIAHRFMERAGVMKREGAASLWAEFAAFEAAGSLIDVSRREAVNRCYRMAIQAQRVPETMTLLHSVLRDRRSEEQARESNRLVQDQQETQHRLGRIEIFIATVYTAELANLLGETARFVPMYRFAGIVGLALLAMITVLSHHQSVHIAPGVARGKRQTTVWFAISLVALVGWLAGGFLRFRASTEQGTSAESQIRKSGPISPPAATDKAAPATSPNLLAPEVMKKQGGTTVNSAK